MKTDFNFFRRHFILNSIVFVFPAIGHWLHLSQEEFGLWCAIAIHDTSSVVAAANKYGPQAADCDNCSWLELYGLFPLH
jgi:uncharacterized membrane protein YadS